MNKKQTGRTTRLLKEAFLLSEAGHAVYVVTHNENHAAQLARELISMQATRPNPARPHGIKTESIEFMGLGPNLEPPKGMHPNCRILVDHYAIERHYDRVLGMLVQFDLAS